MILFETEIEIDVPVIYRFGCAEISATDAELAELVHAAVATRYVKICEEAEDLQTQEVELEKLEWGENEKSCMGAF